MKETRVKVAIVGAGTAGLVALKEVQKTTEDFVLINGGEYGTTCARVGCMPSKALIQVAKDFHRRHKFSELGIENANELKLNVHDAFQRVRNLRNDFVRSVVESIEKLGEKNIQAYAEFEAPHLLRVENQKIYAEKIILAVGSRPVIPDEWKSIEDRLLTSNDVFELEELPKKVAIVGLGVVGLELGQALSRLGAEVEAFELERQMGGLKDSKIIDAAVTAISKDFKINMQTKVSPKDLESFDKVLISIGRESNLDRMKLENANLSLKGSRLKHHPETMLVEGSDYIFVAGDAEPERPLLHEAEFEGRIAGKNAVAKSPQNFKRKSYLQIVFSEPQLAKVGWSLSEIDTPVVGEFSFLEQGRALLMAENEGLLRVYACSESHQILGAEMIAPGAEHLAHFLNLCIERRMTVEEAMELPYYHPCLEEGIRGALGKILAQI